MGQAPMHKECAGSISKVVSFGLAPPLSEFQDCLFAIHSGSHNFSSTTDAAPDQRMRFRRLVFCLAEAKRNQVRASLRQSLSASVQQDVRKAQLLVRVTSCDADLNICSAPLGQCNMAEHFGLSALGVKHCTEYIITKFATKELHVPGRPATDVNMDAELCDTIRKSVLLFAADGAADEQLAGTLLKD